MGRWSPCTEYPASTSKSKKKWVQMVQEYHFYHPKWPLTIFEEV